MAADKVKIDTVEIWEWAMGNWQESYSLSQKDEVLMGIGHWALGIGHWAYLTFLRTAIASTEMKVENHHSYFLSLPNSLLLLDSL